MMRAQVAEAYGKAVDVLKLGKVPKPAPQKDEVLIKVYATSMNAADWHVLNADPFPVRFAFGLFRPKLKVLGVDMAGVVEAVGSAVKQFKVGDRVYGDLSGYKLGCFGEYTVAKEKFIYHLHPSHSFEQAAALPVAGNTAIQAVRRSGRVKSGTRVLVNGASGGVGHYMVQIAKADGAHVTAVCSTKNVDMVRSLGADEVLDYTKTDFTKTSEKYDVILDAAATKSLWTVSRSLVPGGLYYNVGGDTLMHTIFMGGIVSLFTGKSLGIFMVAPRQQDFIDLNALVEQGKLTPFIEKVWPFEELPQALKHVESRRARGKNVVTVATA